MNVLFALVLSATASAPVDHPKTFLASITDIPLKPGERFEGFSISTWGVTFAAIATAMVVLFAPPAARALCIYNGQDNAKTTVAQEFKDSRWVVRAKVLSARDHFSDTEDSWTLYYLEVRHAYKGRPPKRLRFFTTRDSGGFYMDRAGVRLPAGHDISGEYLLFLNPWPQRQDLPVQARGTVFVNYSCGVSGAWAQTSLSERRLLSGLEQGR